jgi:DNA-binding GntR family transcriptional regulator
MSLSLSSQLINTTLPEQVYRLLKDAIERGELPSGSKLLESDVANQLNISRTPVREAINRLAAEGLVTLIPRRGAFVTSLDRKTIRELYEVREALEALAVELAVPTLQNERIEVLEQILEQFAEALDRDDFEAHSRLDRVFHEHLVAFSDNSKLQELFQIIDGSIQITRWMHCDTRETFQAALEEHRRIVAALRARDREEAVRVVRAHIQRVKNDLLSEESQSDVKPQAS